MNLNESNRLPCDPRLFVSCFFLTIEFERRGKGVSWTEMVKKRRKEHIFISISYRQRHAQILCALLQFSFGGLELSFCLLFVFSSCF